MTDLDHLVLEHFARVPVLTLEPDYEYEPLALRMKPDGLWISVAGEDDWRAYCERDELRTELLVNRHTVTIRPEARILLIESSDALFAFHEEHRRRYYGFDFIPWDYVAQSYDGIIIAPYQWTHRLVGGVSDWYYPWDAASGCVWNLDAIASITPTPIAEEARA